MDSSTHRSWWKYEIEMLRRALGRAKVHLALELSLILGGAMAAATAEAGFKGYFNAITFLVGLAGGVGGMFAAVLYFLVREPGRNHNELASVIESLTEGFTFAELLRVRKGAIERISPLENEPDALDRANNQLAQEQMNVIALLHRPDNPWRHAPVGWGKTDAPLHEWAGLARVMELRYQGEISPVVGLYERVSDTQLQIPPGNFPMVREHAATCVSLVIREIELPHRASRAEPSDAFSRFRLAFGPAIPTTTGASLPTGGADIPTPIC